MKLAEKIKEFESIEALISEIKYDKDTNDILSKRYPVRFIFLQSFEKYRMLIENLLSIGVEIYNLEKNLPHSDGWITKDKLINIVKNFTKDTAVVPFSEIVRFYSKDDFKNIFCQLLLIENVDVSRRIYLPLLGIEQRFENDFFQNYTRKNESIFYWKLSGVTKSVKVYLTKFKLPKKIKNYEIIENTEAWFKFWKQKRHCEVICYSTPLNLFYKYTLPDYIFSIEQIDNPKTLLEKVLSIEIPIPYENSEKKFWEEFLNFAGSNFTDFNTFVKMYINVVSLTPEIIIEHWLISDVAFKRWLLKHFVLLQNCLKNKYIYIVFESLSDFTDHALLKALFLKIFDLPISEELVKERLAMIRQFSKIKPITLCDDAVKEIDLKIKSIENLRHALLLTTGILKFEKEYLLKLYTNGKVSDTDLLFSRFPEISYYISECSFDNLKNENEWVLEYLMEYKKSKLNDSISYKLNEILLLKNANEESFYNWYNSFESIHSIFHSNKVDKVIWIDALGIEWVSFIENYLKEQYKDIFIIKKLIGVARLPTSTDQNKFPEIKYVQDFDYHIHSSKYSFPISIINQFEEIKKIIDKFIILDSEQTIAIVSDHGLTALSRLVDSKKYGKDDSHEGRFVEVDEEEHINDTDYIFHKSEIDKKKYLIALKHNSLGKKPIREVHGGATPEEVLVPFIIISNKKDIGKIDFKITIEKNEISKRDPILSFTILPKPSVALIEIKGEKTKLNFNEKNQKWEKALDKSLSGEIQVKVIVESTINEFIIKIKSGISEEDLF